MGTSVAYSCNQGVKEDFYEKVWKDLTNMALTDLIKMWLLHDIAMYNDVLAIIGLTANGITWNEYHLMYTIFKIFYSIAIVAMHVPNTNQDEFPYPNTSLDIGEERQLTD